MRKREGLAEELSRLFYNRSGPILRAVQRRISQPGVWWKFASVSGIGLGGFLVVLSGYVPWWRENYGVELTGLDFARGQAVVGLGSALLVIAMLRVVLAPSAARLPSLVAAFVIAWSIVAIALIEEHIANPVGWHPLDSGWYVLQGYYVAISGGIIAFVGSLCGLAPDPDPVADPPPRFARYT